MECKVWSVKCGVESGGCGVRNVKDKVRPYRKWWGVFCGDGVL